MNQREVHPACTIHSRDCRCHRCARSSFDSTSATNAWFIRKGTTCEISEYGSIPVLVAHPLVLLRRVGCWSAGSPVTQNKLSSASKVIITYMSSSYHIHMVLEYSNITFTPKLQQLCTTCTIIDNRHYGSPPPPTMRVSCLQLMLHHHTPLPYFHRSSTCACYQ